MLLSDLATSRVVGIAELIQNEICGSVPASLQRLVGHRWRVNRELSQTLASQKANSHQTTSGVLECAVPAPLICLLRESKDDVGRTAADARRLTRWKRWLSLHPYGVVTRTLFGARTPPERMRARFERFGAVSRARLQRKFPNLAFEDHTIGQRTMESVRAVKSPSCMILHIHGGAFVMGSRDSYRNRAMRLSYRCKAEELVPDYRLPPSTPVPRHWTMRSPLGNTRRTCGTKCRSLSVGTRPAAASG